MCFQLEKDGAEDQEEQEEAELEEAESPWKKGMLISISTEDGTEKDVKILGPAESGNKQEMCVKFRDGTIDDWEIEEFVKSTEPPLELVRTQVRIRPKRSN